jgi:putative ABC transport system permease protein
MPFGLEGMPANAPESELLEWATDLVDFDFITTMGMEIKEGRTFQRGMSTDSMAFVINEAAVKSAVAKLGEAWRSPIGKRLDYYTSHHAEWRIHKSGPVIGVVKDFNYRSLHHEVGPIALQIGPQALFHLVVKIKGDQIGEALALLEDKWKKLFPDRPFNYQFLDENLDRQYHAEKKAEQIITALHLWRNCAPRKSACAKCSALR